MTKEEKIAVLKALWRYKDCGYSEYEIRESLEFAIEELLKEPCEDCVSRKAVIKAVDSHTFDTNNGLCLDDDISCILEELSPVTPTRKRGKWVLHTYMPHKNYCSECEKDSPYNKRWGFCPNCGAEMESKE